MAEWSRWLESATRRVGFRALKKALEALYTTKVNNRDRTSRGTTHLKLLSICFIVFGIITLCFTITLSEKYAEY